MKVLRRERLTELLDVFPNEGKMVWKPRVGLPRLVNSWNFRHAGKEAGSLHKNGFLSTTIDGKAFKLHRLIWLYVYGEMPDGLIDHINGDPSDNRIGNLRVATPSENAKNAKLSSANKSGCPGVCWASDHERWKVRASVNGREKTIGHFSKLEDAIAARKHAEARFGYHPNHGRVADRP